MSKLFKSLKRLPLWKVLEWFHANYVRSLIPFESFPGKFSKFCQYWYIFFITHWYLRWELQCISCVTFASNWVVIVCRVSGFCILTILTNQIFFIYFGYVLWNRLKVLNLLSSQTNVEWTNFVLKNQIKILPQKLIDVCIF